MFSSFGRANSALGPRKDRPNSAAASEVMCLYGQICSPENNEFHVFHIKWNKLNWIDLNAAVLNITCSFKILEMKAQTYYKKPFSEITQKAVLKHRRRKTFIQWSPLVWDDAHKSWVQNNCLSTLKKELWWKNRVLYPVIRLTLLTFVRQALILIGLQLKVSLKTDTLSERKSN